MEIISSSCASPSASSCSSANFKVEVELARRFRHDLGVKKTTVLIGGKGDGDDGETYKSVAATVDVPCLAINDFVNRIQQAATTNTSKK